MIVLRFRHTGWDAGSRWQAFCTAAWGQTLSTNLTKHCEEEA